MKNQVSFATVNEGPLFSFFGEDGELFSFDCVVEVKLRDGRSFRHPHTFLGKGRDAETGISFVRHSRAEARAFADRVEIRGFINAALWVDITNEVVPDLEERLAGYAAEEAAERARGW